MQNTHWWMDIKLRNSQPPCLPNTSGFVLFLVSPVNVVSHRSLWMISVAQGAFCAAPFLGSKSFGRHRPDGLPRSGWERSCDTWGRADGSGQCSCRSHRVSGWTGGFVFLWVTFLVDACLVCSDLCVCHRHVSICVCVCVCVCVFFFKVTPVVISLKDQPMSGACALVCACACMHVCVCVCVCMYVQCCMVCVFVCVCVCLRMIWMWFLTHIAHQKCESM